MKYRLHRDYQLRGWKGATCALINTKNHDVSFIDKDIYSILLLSDGVTEIERDTFSARQLEELDRYIEHGVIETCAAPAPILPEQRYRLYGNRYVESILWSVTGKCNFRCRHCYMDAPNGHLGEMNHEDALRLIDEMAACGIQKVELTGGETFVRKDIWELIDRLLGHGICIDQIYTNGWLVNDALLDKLEQCSCKPAIVFSFDGIGWHDWLRGVRGAEEAALRAMKLCRSRGFAVSVEMCLHKGNLSTLPDTIRLMGELDIPVKCSNISDTELWQNNNDGLALSASEYLDAMIAFIPEYFRMGMPVRVLLCETVQLFRNSADYHIVANRYDGTEQCLERHLCGSARSSVYISPEGRLVPCMPMTAWKGHSQFPRVQDIGLKAGLTDSLFMCFVNSRVRDLLSRNAECSACDKKYLCGGGCRAKALEAAGDLYGCDRTQCTLLREGYAERIRAAIEAAIAEYCPSQG